MMTRTERGRTQPIKGESAKSTPPVVAPRARPAPRRLPPSLARIAAHLGNDAAVAIARAYGPVGRLYIPMPEMLTDRHPLVRLIGHQAALRLTLILGTGEIQIPTARHYLNWYDSVQLYRAGRHAGEIARELGLTARHVRRLLEEVPASPGFFNSEPPARCQHCGSLLPGVAPAKRSK